MMDVGKVYIPGERLFKAGSEYVAGTGTYIVHGYIYASMAGYLKVISGHDEKRCRVEIERPDGAKGPATLPSVGDIVTCKVTGTFSRHVKCSIMCVLDRTLPHPFSGAIRKDDIVSVEKHKVDIFKSFRTGDVLLARVLGFGDTASYLLTTAEAALGVTWGRCKSGHRMMPINDQEIQCDQCGIVEQRKVAELQLETDESDTR